VAAIREEVIADAVALHIPPGSLEEQWDVEGLSKALEAEFGLNVDIAGLVAEDKSINDDGIRDYCIEQAARAYAEREQKIGSELMRNVEKQVMLRQLDHHWKEHLAAMDHLRQGIGLRSYAQKNPKQEYKREAFEMFGAMMEQVKHDTISILTRIRIQGEDDLAEMQRQREEQQKLKFQHPQASALGAQAPAAPAPGPVAAQQGQAAPQGLPRQGGESPAAVETFVRDGRKVGRNEPCPCGSGKKFKRCHGQLS
jgi:preprotein translocase subunit SecA